MLCHMQIKRFESYSLPSQTSRPNTMVSGFSNIMLTSLFLKILNCQFKFFSRLYDYQIPISSHLFCFLSLSFLFLKKYFLISVIFKIWEREREIENTGVGGREERSSSGLLAEKGDCHRLNPGPWLRSWPSRNQESAIHSTDLDTQEPP